MFHVTMKIIYSISLLFCVLFCKIDLYDCYETVEEALKAMNGGNEVPELSDDETRAKLIAISEEIAKKDNRIFGTSLKVVCPRHKCDDPKHLFTPDFVHEWMKILVTDHKVWNDLRFINMSYEPNSVEIKYYTLKEEVNENPTTPKLSSSDSHRFILERLLRDFIRELTVPLFPLDLMRKCHDIILAKGHSAVSVAVAELKQHFTEYAKTNKHEYDMLGYITRFFLEYRKHYLHGSPNAIKHVTEQMSYLTFYQLDKTDTAKAHVVLEFILTNSKVGKGIVGVSPFTEQFP